MKFLPGLLFLAYALWPGDPEGLLPGWPSREANGIVTIAVLGGLAVVWAVAASTTRAWMPMTLFALLVAKGALAPLVVAEGWSSRYVLHSMGTTVHDERIGRRARDGGVIDSAIALTERSAALQFLNDHQLDPEPIRQAAFVAEWRGHVALNSGARARLQSPVRGSVQVAVDGEAVEMRPSTPIDLSPGIHQILVEYRKPSGELPGISIALETESGGAVPVYADAPSPAALRMTSWVRIALRVMDVVALGVAVSWLLPYVSGMIATLRRQRETARLTLLFGLPLALFAIHGLVAASMNSDLRVFLWLDDMRVYASDGRDIVLNGLLMNRGQPIFNGQPSGYYPLYPYFVALSYTLFDESLYGLVLLQFVLLGATVVIIVRLTFEMFGEAAAWLAMLMLCVIGEINFARYYTVSVFSDNLYYPLVAAAVFYLWRVEATGNKRAVIVAGLLCGLATLTRPSMLIVMPFVGAWLLVRRHPGPAGRQAAFVLTACFIAVIGFATFRNWLVSGRFIPLQDSSLKIVLFLAPPGVNHFDYMPSLKASDSEMLWGALRLFLDYPAGVLMVQARKLAFMMGVTNVVPEYRLQPHFVALSVAYLGWWIMSRRQGPSGVAIHLTLLGHVIAFLIATPISYGYKTILTLVMLFVPFASAFLCDALCRMPGFAKMAPGVKAWAGRGGV